MYVFQNKVSDAGWKVIAIQCIIPKPPHFPVILFPTAEPYWVFYTINNILLILFSCLFLHLSNLT